MISVRVLGVWVRKGRAYLPTIAQTEAGYFMDIEPISVANLTKEELITAAEKVLVAGHPKLPTPTREEFRRRRDPLLTVAKVRSRREFEKDAINFNVTWTGERIMLNVADAETGFKFDPERRRVFPLDTPLATIIEAILEPAPKHGPIARGAINVAPRHGQEALNSSIQVKPTSPRRAGIDYETGEFVVFDQTTPGMFHGHVRTWQHLSSEMQSALQQAGLVDARGRILVEP